MTVDSQSIQKSTTADQESGDLPELAGSNSQAMVQATCECEYSLKGSDIRCDMDQTIEKSSFLSADNPASNCRRGQTLCKDICPPGLP